MNTPKSRPERARGSLAVIVSTALLAAYLPSCKADDVGERTGHTEEAIAVEPTLGTAQSYAVLGASTVTNTGPTVITGDLGVSPGTAITGFPPGIVVGGSTHAADAVAAQAQADNATAYGALASQACDTSYPAVMDIGGLTLAPGVYCFPSSAGITGDLTLDAQGDPAATWVFKIGSTLVTAPNSSVKLINGAQNCKVFWQVGSSATVDVGSTFVGSILALTSITLNTNATVSGRALAQNGAVTMDSNAVSVSACAVVPVNPPPTLGKDFSPPTITAGGSSTLTLTLNNPATSPTSLTAPLTDALPAGVVVSGAATTTCGGVVSTGTSSVTLTGGSIPASGSCFVTVPVTAASGGSYLNSIAAGALQTGNGNNGAPAVATLTVVPVVIAPALGKAFSPATITAGGGSTLTITLSNTDATPAIMTAPLTDALPSGVLTSGSGSTTCGGTVTTSSGSVVLSGGTIPALGSCTVTVPVTAPSAGDYINSMAAGALQTSNGNNGAPAIATLSATAPTIVTLGKAFSPATIPAGGSSTLTLTLSNPNATPALMTSPLTDALPSGMSVSGSGTTTCGGTLAASASTVTLTGGTIPANGSCTVTVPVTVASGGSYINSIAAGALQTSNGNNGGNVVATLTVSAPTPVTLGKAFSPATVTAGGISLLTITLSNTNGTPATLSAPLVDTLPSGMVTSGAATSTCGGTASTTPSTVTLTGGSIPANGSCKVTVNVKTAVAGSYFNSLPAGALQTNKGINAAPAVATLTTAAPIVAPGLAKAFSPSSIAAGGTSTLTITLSNPNASVTTLTAPLVDSLPTGLYVSGSASTTCGGTLTAATGSSTVTLTGGTIPANGTCKILVNVKSTCAGTFVNKLAIGALKCGNGSNTTTANATLIVAPAAIPPTVSKSFSPSSVKPGDISTLTITLYNANSTPASQTTTLTDSFPGGTLVSSGTCTNTCGGTVVALAGGSKVTLTGAVIPANGSCKVSVKVKTSCKGSFVNTISAGALQTSKGSNASSCSATLSRAY